MIGGENIIYSLPPNVLAKRVVNYIWHDNLNLILLKSWKFVYILIVYKSIFYMKILSNNLPVNMAFSLANICVYKFVDFEFVVSLA